MFEVHLYITTDSKCLRPTRGCWGYVLEYNSPRNGIKTKCEVGDGVATDKGLLLAAVERACSRIKGDSHIFVHTNSAFVASVFNGWFETWKANDWIGAGGQEVKYKGVLSRLSENDHIKEISAEFHEKEHPYECWLLMSIKSANLGAGCSKEIKAQ